jgi:hypothetical protein
VRRTVPPSAEIEARIERMLSVGVGESPRESLSELARLGARLIIERAVEDEFDAWLGRARYERRPDGERGLRNYGPGLRNGFRARTVQTAEGELEIEIPQVREAAETFASKLFPRTPKLLRTEPLKPDQRHPLQPTRPSAPQTGTLRRQRAKHPRGGRSRLDWPPPGTGFTAPKRRHRSRGETPPCA